MKALCPLVGEILTESCQKSLSLINIAELPFIGDEIGHHGS